MARIIINNKKEVKGYMTASTKTNSVGNVILVGELFIHRHFDDINRIETDRYLLKDVSIVGFSIGSNDFFIKHEFECELDNLTFKGGETNLDETTIREIEVDIFSEEAKEKMHIKNNKKVEVK